MALNVYMRLQEEHPLGVTKTCHTTGEYTGVSFRKVLDTKPRATLCVPRNTVHNLARRNKSSTVQKIAEEISKSEHISTLQMWTIRCTLHKIGFVLKKHE